MKKRLFSPEQTYFRPGLVRRVAINTLGVAAAVGLSAGAVAGIDYLANRPKDKTHFGTESTAMAKLKANIESHGKDLDVEGSAQDQMVSDLRGANPKIMRKLGTKVVSAGAVFSGKYQLQDGRSITVTSDPYLNNGDSVSVVLKDSGSNRTEEVWLGRTHNGDFDSLHYRADTLNHDKSQGGRTLDYDFSDNNLSDSNTTQYRDDHGQLSSPLSGDDVIVSDSYFSENTAAGPATKTIFDDTERANKIVDMALQALPHK